MIIFLDIDGVLHPEPAAVEQAFCRRHLLWKLLNARPAVQIVISSVWREQHSLDALTGLILANGDAGLKYRFVGTTPVLPGVKHEYRGRELECLAWLDTNASCSPWLAIDDVAGNFMHGSTHIMLTDYRVGLTAQNIENLLSRIPP